MELDMMMMRMTNLPILYINVREQKQKDIRNNKDTKFYYKA